MTSYCVVTWSVEMEDSSNRVLETAGWRCDVALDVGIDKSEGVS